MSMVEKTNKQARCATLARCATIINAKLTEVHNSDLKQTTIAGNLEMVCTVHFYQTPQKIVTPNKFKELFFSS